MAIEPIQTGPRTRRYAPWRSPMRPMRIRPQSISMAFGFAFVLACEVGVSPTTDAASVERLESAP